MIGQSDILNYPGWFNRDNVTNSERVFFKTLHLCLPTVETCFMELRSLLVGAPQGDFRNSKGSEALIGQMSVFGLHLSILLTPFSGLHITYNRY